MKSPSSTRIWIYVVLLCSISCTSNEGGQGSDESVNGLVFAQCESTPPECSLPCGMDDVDDDERGEIREEGCWITGGGHLGDANARGGAGKNRQDSFGFNAMGTKQGTVRGQIQNTTHLGDVFHGQATWLECWRDGGEGPEVPKAHANRARWGGPGTWNHEGGYTFEAAIADRAEGGSRRDAYEITVRDAAGTVVYQQSTAQDRVISGGNIQIHPPNAGHPYVVN